MQGKFSNRFLDPGRGCLKRLISKSYNQLVKLIIGELNCKIFILIVQFIMFNTPCYFQLMLENMKNIKTMGKKLMVMMTLILLNLSKSL